MHSANFLSQIDGGNRNVSCMYKSSMDTLHFMVERNSHERKTECLPFLVLISFLLRIPAIK